MFWFSAPVLPMKKLVLLKTLNASIRNSTLSGLLDLRPLDEPEVHVPDAGAAHGRQA